LTLPPPNTSLFPSRRSSDLKDVDLQSWQAIFMPKNTPKEIISQLNKEINKILNNDEIQNNFSKLGMEVKGGSPEALADLINREIDRKSTRLNSSHVSISYAV